MKNYISMILAIGGILLFTATAFGQTSTPTNTAVPTATPTATTVPTATPTPFPTLGAITTPTPGGNYPVIIQKSLSNGNKYFTSPASIDDVTLPDDLTIDNVNTDDIFNPGVLNGLVASDSGGLEIAWTSGQIFNNSQVAISITSGTALLTDNVENFVVWDSGTTLTVQVTKTTATQVEITHAAVQAGDIWDLHSESYSNDAIRAVREGLEDAFPVVTTSGCLVSEDTDVANVWDVVLSAGVYYHDLHEKHPVAQINSKATLMVRWYRSSGVWTSDTNAEIDITMWDNGTDLAAVSGSKDYKSLFFFTDSTIHWVYPQVEYNTPAQARAAALPSLPPGLLTLPTSMAVVIAGNAAAFPAAGTVDWVDSRQLPTSVGGAAGVSDHGNLTGLTDITDHAYAALVDGSRNITGTQTFEAGITMQTGQVLTTETIKAVDGDGLTLKNDGGDTVLTIADDGNVDIANNLSIGNGANDDDDFLYFDQGNEWFAWDNAPVGIFYLSEGLDIAGDLLLDGDIAMLTGKTLTAGKINAINTSGVVISNAINEYIAVGQDGRDFELAHDLQVGTADTEDNDTIFFDVGLQTFLYDEITDDRFELSAGLLIPNTAILTAETIQAVDADGLSLKDDGGNLGVFIKDGGQVGIGINTPTSAIDIVADDDTGSGGSGDAGIEISSGDGWDSTSGSFAGSGGGKLSTQVSGIGGSGFDNTAANGTDGGDGGGETTVLGDGGTGGDVTSGSSNGSGNGGDGGGVTITTGSGGGGGSGISGSAAGGEGGDAGDIAFVPGPGVFSALNVNPILVCVVSVVKEPSRILKYSIG